MRPPTRMDNANRFKLGLFCTNCSGALAMTKVPERWDASWDNNVTAARMAAEAGIEFILPIARWHGYQGQTNTSGSSYETLTWASGLLAATEEITVFGTVHVPFINPVLAAKQIVTADHVGKGRFGLNIVSGWNQGEFDMFGVDLLEHDARYDYSEEWLTIVNKIWSDGDPFDFEGNFFKLSGVVSNPKPHGGGRPLVMSAGSSDAGRAFAARHADCLFMIVVDLDKLAGDVARVVKMVDDKSRARVFCSGHIVCRPTQKEAEEYYRYYVHEMGDWDAVEHMMEIRQQSHSVPKDRLPQIKERLISGLATFPVIGSPDTVAETLRQMTVAGLSGMAFGLVNFVDELPFIREALLPRLVRLGLRER